MKQSLPDTTRAAAETFDVMAASEVDFCRREFPQHPVALKRALARQASTTAITEGMRRAADRAEVKDQ